mgnify:CR=1 FL=1|tara:strand:- start:69 stop:590 length:522 start_codon:yes stop_codon:yes gene_type:complete
MSDEEIIKIKIWGEEFSLTKEKFFGLIEHYDEDEAEEDDWDFEACDGTFDVSVENNEYSLSSSFVDPTVDFLYLLNPKGKYVVLVEWSISNNTAFEVQFSNCECTESLNEYYGEIEYLGGCLVADKNHKLIKANSDYFQDIEEDIDDRYVDGDVQVYTLSKWTKSFKKILHIE